MSMSRAEIERLLNLKLDKTGGIVDGSLTVKRNLDVKGTFTASHVMRSYWADLAEYFPADDYNNIPPGTLMMIDNKSSNENYVVAVAGKGKLIGATSNEFGYVLGGNPDETDPEKVAKGYVAIALAGRIHVRCIGPVKPGDRIGASEIPGVGRVVGEDEDSIGYAVTGNGINYSELPDSKIVRFAAGIDKYVDKVLNKIFNKLGIKNPSKEKETLVRVRVW